MTEIAAQRSPAFVMNGDAVETEVPKEGREATLVVLASSGLYIPDELHISINEDEKFVIGSSKFADFNVKLRCVAAKHAVFTIYNGNWIITNRASKPIYVNKKLIKEDFFCILKDGDEIEFGNVQSLKVRFSTSINNETAGDELSGPLSKRFKPDSFNKAVQTGNEGVSCANQTEQLQIPCTSRCNKEPCEEIKSCCNNEPPTEIKSRCNKELPEEMLQRQLIELRHAHEEEQRRANEFVQELVEQLTKEIDSHTNEVKVYKSLMETVENDAKNAVKRIVEDLVDSELQCLICMNIYVQAVTLQCHHMFCNFCIRQWSQTSQDCPVCRKLIVLPLSIHNTQLNSFIEAVMNLLSEDAQRRRRDLIASRSNSVPVSTNSHLNYQTPENVVLE